MKRVLATIVFAILALHSGLHAQQYMRKNGVVSLDGKPILTYTVHKSPGVKISSYTALGEDRVLFQAHFCNNWSYRGSDDYRHYYFPGSELELILPSRRKYRFKFLLPMMVEEGVLDMDGNWNDEALKAFVAKYHVPLPKAFGNKAHQLPVVQPERSQTHRLRYLPD